MGDRFFISDYIRLIAPYLRPELVSPQQLHQIQAIASQWPGSLTHVFGLECRLGAAERRVDFIFCIDREEGATLAGSYPGILPPEVFGNDPTWRRIRDFCTDWSAVGSGIRPHVKDIWLEYDLVSAERINLIPSILIGIDPDRSGPSGTLDPYDWLFSLALPKLVGGPLPTAVQGSFLDCVRNLPENAYLSYVGAFLAREVPIIRICISGIKTTRLLAYLKAIQYPAQTAGLERLADRLAAHVAKPVLNIDVGAGIGPRVGLELKMERQYFIRYKKSIEWLLQTIVAEGWCTSQKREAFLAYPGLMQPQAGSREWPEALVSPPDPLMVKSTSVIQRDLSHIKLVYEPEDRIEAKLYLGAYHFWLTPLEVIKARLAYSASS